MKRFIFVLTIILTFGLCLLPIVNCASYNEVSQLDRTNRILNIEKDSSTDRVIFTINNSDIYNASTIKRYTIQAFDKNNNCGLFNINNFNGTITAFLTNDKTANSGQGMSYYSTSGNYSYYYSSTNTYNYLIMKSSYGISAINTSDYVFNITLSNTSLYLNEFVPNTFYNLADSSDNGFFNDWKVYNVLESRPNNVDISSETIFYNTINLGMELDSYASTNSRDTYQQSLYITTNNMVVGRSPQIYLRYCEITQITINNVSYTYTEARQLYGWLNSNITLYNDNATLFSFTLGDQINDVISNINLRVSDYAFRSSSYYNSSIGTRGYLKDFYISVINETNSTVYNTGYQNGYTIGKENGYNSGFNDGVNSNKTGFDNMMFAIADVPIHIISSMLNFNILGINLMSFFMAIITLMLFVFLIRKFKE